MCLLGKQNFVTIENTEQIQFNNTQFNNNDNGNNENNNNNNNNNNNGGTLNTTPSYYE